MINESFRINADAEKINIEIEKIENKISNLYAQVKESLQKSSFVSPVLNDINNAITTLIYLDYSCKFKAEVVGKDFLPYWHFERNLYVEMMVLIKRLFELINCVFNTKIKGFSDLKTFIDNRDNFVGNVKLRNKLLKLSENNYLKEKIQIRGKIEHGVDPYFDGDFIDLKNSFNIEKMYKGIKNIYELVIILSNMQLKTTPANNAKIEKIKDYKKENHNFLASLLEDMCNFDQDIYKYAYVYSKYVNDIKNSKSLPEKYKQLYKIVSDITFKYQLLKRTLGFSLGSLSLKNLKQFKRFNLNYFINEEVYEYFTILSLNTMYSIYDKIGAFLLQMYEINLNKTYFKDVIEYISKNNDIGNDDFIKNLYNLRESEEYKILSNIRKNYVHGYNDFDYGNYIEVISNILIKNMKEIQPYIVVINKWYLSQISRYINIHLNIEDNQYVQRNTYLVRTEFKSF